MREKLDQEWNYDKDHCNVGKIKRKEWVGKRKINFILLNRKEREREREEETALIFVSA